MHFVAHPHRSKGTPKALSIDHATTKILRRTDLIVLLLRRCHPVVLLIGTNVTREQRLSWNIPPHIHTNSKLTPAAAATATATAIATAPVQTTATSDQTIALQGHHHQYSPRHGTPTSQLVRAGAHWTPKHRPSSRGSSRCCQKEARVGPHRHRPS